jgi:type IV pilus assembly protein PilA
MFQINKKKAFTLVELMIVVAIIGILAAIAVPNFVAMQYRAKRAEVPSNVDGIKTAELAYDAAFDAFVVQSTYVPGAAPSKVQQVWPSTGTGFATIGWAPDGAVRGQYNLVSTTSTGFTVNGRCDVDNDESNATFSATRDSNAAMGTANDIY